MTKTIRLANTTIALLAGTMLTAAMPAAAAEVTPERLVNADKEPQNWLSYWGDLEGRHFSALNQITPANVATLQARWAVQMPGDGIVEAVPVVVDGVMYTTGVLGRVFAAAQGA